MQGQPKKLTLKCTKLPSDSLGLTNKVYLSPQDTKAISLGAELPYVEIKGYIFVFEEHKQISPGMIGLNFVHRKFMNFGFNDPVDVSTFTPNLASSYLSTLTLDVEFQQKNRKSNEEYKAVEIAAVVKNLFTNQFFTVDQKFAIEFNGVNLELTVKTCETTDLNLLKEAIEEKKNPSPADNSQQKKPAGPVPTARRGILHMNTGVLIEKAEGAGINLSGGLEETGTRHQHIFQKDWNFSKMGIGGLSEEFNRIFRQAFASRIFPIATIKQLGIKHVKGILLFGPPGTGKTLMARQIGKMLNGKEPKVVNGPEILNKYVGQSEENIRLLFKDAEAEYKEKGEASSLHIIIFDEIDAICKQRGSRNDGTGVGDTVVNQLLSKIDGVNALNNVLIIGMTNRKDLIDEALLRAGRLEVHIEVTLPSEEGRVEILKIHTAELRRNKSMDPSINNEEFIRELAQRTKNFSGAEIEALVRSAASFALDRKLDVTEGIKVKDGPVVLEREDFEYALQEVKPAFGITKDEFENCKRNGIIRYSPRVDKLLRTGAELIEQVRNSSRTPLLSLLLEGPTGSGKTALAAELATSSGFPFVKLISPEMFMGYSEASKCAKITKIFEDSYRSPLSCIVIDNIERLLEYTRIGPRFANPVLQTLMVLLKTEPPKYGNRLLTISTSSNVRLLQEMELYECFNAAIQVPQITNKDEFQNALKGLQIFPSLSQLEEAAQEYREPISIKKLIMLTEMTKQVGQSNLVEAFRHCMSETF